MVTRQQQTWSGDNDPGEFRGICRGVIDAVADYHAYLSGRGVLPDFTPGEVRALLAGRHPVYSETPTEMEAS